MAFLIGNLRPDIEGKELLFYSNPYFFTVFLVEPEDKQLSNLLANNVPCPVDTLDTMADGVRVAHVGTLCEPILRKFCTGKVISVVSVLS